MTNDKPLEVRVSRASLKRLEQILLKTDKTCSIRMGEHRVTHKYLFYLCSWMKYKLYGDTDHA